MVCAESLEVDPVRLHLRRRGTYFRLKMRHFNQLKNFDRLS